jgi:hypothetical protein
MTRIRVTVECPFRCGWTADDHDPEDARLALCSHLIGEHGATEERDQEAAEDALDCMLSPDYEPPQPPFRFD